MPDTDRLTLGGSTYQGAEHATITIALHTFVAVCGVVVILSRMVQPGTPLAMVLGLCLIVTLAINATDDGTDAVVRLIDALARLVEACRRR